MRGSSPIGSIPVKLITLDAFGTIIKTKKPVGEIYVELALKHGVTCDADEITGEFRQRFAALAKQKPCYGYRQDGSVSWWCELVARSFAKVDCDKSLLREVCQKLFYHFTALDPWQLVDDKVHGHLAELRRNGAQIAVISNFDSRLRLILDAFGLSRHIDAYFLSGEVGLEKPDAKIFRMAADYFGISNMQEIVHVGDSIETDFNGARMAGTGALLMKTSLDASGKSAELISVPHDLVVSSFGDVVKKCNQAWH